MVAILSRQSQYVVKGVVQVENKDPQVQQTVCNWNIIQ